MPTSGYSSPNSNPIFGGQTLFACLIRGGLSAMQTVRRLLDVVELVFGVPCADVINAVFTHPWMHAYTYSGHPVGCAVALRTLQILDEENLVADAARKGA